MKHQHISTEKDKSEALPVAEAACCGQSGDEGACCEPATQEDACCSPTTDEAPCC